MNILISNDDGINSKALRTLVKVLSDLGDIYVVAPDSERSANSHHFTFRGKMRIEEKEVEGAKKAYAFWGTPCDCIHAGMQFIIPEKIDLIVSGINKGSNVTSDVIYSGTVAAAREGFIQGIKSIALSLDTFDDRDYTTAAMISKKIIEAYIKEDNPENYFLNVNIPDMPYEEIKGLRVCPKEGKVIYHENYRYEEEFGVKYVALDDATKDLLYDLNDPDIDSNALRDGYVAITPLYNNHVYMNEISSFRNKWDGFSIK